MVFSFLYSIVDSGHSEFFLNAVFLTPPLLWLYLTPRFLVMLKSQNQKRELGFVVLGLILSFVLSAVISWPVDKKISQISRYITRDSFKVVTVIDDKNRLVEETIESYKVCYVESLKERVSECLESGRPLKRPSAEVFDKIRKEEAVTLKTVEP